MHRRWSKGFCATATVTAVALSANLALAQPYGARPFEGQQERDERSGEHDGSMEGEADRRRRDAPSEDGTLAPRFDDGPPGCLLREPSLELIV